MSSESTPTRARMIDAAIQQLRRSGVAGMSFTQVLETSGAARGAIYHHFPGGKAQLVAEAARVNGEQVRASLAALPGTTPAEIVEAFLETVRPVVEASATGSGCAIAAVTMGTTEPDDALRDVASAVFRSWTTALSQRLAANGLDDDDAAALATTLLTLLEGAHVLTRAAGDIEPFDQAARTLIALLRR